MFFETKNLCFSYYKQPLCLKDINFSLNKGQKLVCIASKNMGKTTLLKVFSSFETSYFGKILLDGKELKTINDYDKNFSLLLSQPVFIKNKSIKFNMDYFCEINNLDKFSNEQIQNMLNQWNISRRPIEKISKMSIFEKRKLAIIRALLKQPNIIFLDDQFDNLNKDEFNEMKDIYLRLFNNSKLTIIATAGENCYKSIVKNNDIFDKEIHYLCNAELKSYKNPKDFEEKRDNFDIINFLENYESVLVDLVFENNEYKLVLYDDFVVLNSKLTKNLFFENFESQECLILIKKENLDDKINLKVLLDLLETGKANLYALLGGERLI